MRSPRVFGLRFPSALALAGSLVAAAVLGVSCSSNPGTPPPASSTAAVDPSTPPTPPTVRLYLLSSPAGAIEPCGCSKDQLGGIDHLAAFLASEKARAPHSMLLGAGPMLFQDPVLEADSKQQDMWKADAMAKSLGKLGLVTWAPASNDWAGGAEELESARKASGAAFVAANLSGAPNFVASKLVDVGGIKVGVVGLSDPSAALGKAPEGITVSAAKDALKKEIAALTAQGARVLVATVSIQRGDALRLADEVPELNVLLVGKAVQKGDGNDKQKPATLVNDTLVVEPSNHLQTIAVVDLFVRDAGDKRVVFADAGGVARAEELVTLSERIRELEAKLNGWANDKKVDPRDVAARRADLERLRSDKYKLEVEAPPPAGSFFRYEAVEVRDKMGAQEDVTKVLLDHYKRVNEHNKVAFASRVPEPAPKGQASYVGVDKCAECHTEEKKVWDASAHAHAYETLQKKFVEYNLECVGCHVTGYGKAGGSTVTHVEKLTDVGCETCHGPGSLHTAKPEVKGLVARRPDPQSCVSECHHPPHVEGFDPVAKMQHVLGPGHGM